MRTFPFLLVLFFLLSCAPAPHEAPTNILLITIDTLRFDRLGCTGCPSARTPVLDNLAREGVLFDCCIVSAPITLPSHCTIMTGLLPFEMAVRDNKPFALAQEAQTLAEILKENGYATLAVVSGEPLAPGCGLEQGFDAYLFKPESRKSRASLLESTADATTTLALQKADNLKSDEPYFFWIHYFDPHFPYEPPGGLSDSIEYDPAEAYDGEVAFVDQEIGRLLRGLKNRGLLSFTLTAVMSDHGEGLGDHDEATHAYFLYDTTVRVPLIIKGPGIEQGRICSDQVRALDLMDALLALGRGGQEGTGDSGRTAGKALAAYLLEGEPLPRSEPAFSESLYCFNSFRWAQITSWRENDRKLIRGAREEEYDLTRDPEEARCIPEQAEPSDWTRLSQHLERFQTKARPRITQGPVFEIDLPGYFGGTGRGGEQSFLTDDTNRSLPHPPSMAGTLNRLLAGIAQVDGGNLNKARSLLEEVVREDPGNPTAWFWLGRSERAIAEKEGNLALLQKARASFERALKLNPEFLDAFHMSTWCLIQSGAFDEAKEALDGYNAQGAKNAKTWELLGYLFITKVSAGKLNPHHDPDQAFDCFDRALAMKRNQDDLLQKTIDLAGSNHRPDLQKKYSSALKKLREEGWR